jgi:hypothetical protein
MAVGCGKNTSDGTSAVPDQEVTENRETADKGSEKDTESQETGDENREAESESPETDENTSDENNASDVDPAMIDLANSNLQTKYNQTAFDDNYIYFHARDCVYKCRYDGSDVSAVIEDKALQNMIVADGKLWGYWWTGDSDDPDPRGLYSVDLETGTLKAEIESPDKNIRRWQCRAYLGSDSGIMRGIGLEEFNGKCYE